MKRITCLTRIVLLCLGWVAPAFAQDIVINEIMFHPLQPPSGPEVVAHEYIELYNAGTNTVNLTGWRLKKSVDFTFTNVSLAPSNYLVVAADTNAFAAKYPGVLNVVGNWVGTLANIHSEVRLEDATGQTIDDVQYATSGDWAVRQRGADDLGHRGWIWQADADGFGKSLERRNPRVMIDSGQNWSASGPTNGTPGRVNSNYTNNLPPLILDFAHFPVVPKSTDPVIISARIVDELPSGLTVTLFYRVDSVAPPAFTSTPMFDDGTHGDVAGGDGLYAVTIPAQPNGNVVEFYVQATDSTGHVRTWPPAAKAAADGVGPSGQVANALYQVDDNPQNAFGGVVALQPVYKMIMTENERAELAGIPCSGAQNSNAEMNGTFISFDGVETLVRYVVGFRNRGHGSRCATPPNYKVSFRTDDLWKGIRGLNINAVNTHIQIFGSALALKSGAPGPRSRAAQVRVNNLNRAISGSPMFGSYAANEEVDNTWAANRYPDDSGGNVYRALRDITPPEFDYRVSSVYPSLPGPENPASYSFTFFKESNKSQDDWTDLIGMLRVIGLNGTTPFTSANVRQAVNVDEWMLHLAVMNLFGNNETGLNTGYNDDYFMYRGVNDPRFQLVFWDLDTIIGEGGSLGTGASLFTASANNGSGNAFNRFLHFPEFEPIYYANLQHLLDTSFSATEFNSLLDEVLGPYVTSGTIINMKNWMNARRAFVQTAITGLVPTNYNTVVVISGGPRSPTPFNTATFTVGGKDITHYKFKLDNGAFSVETPVATPISLSSLANGAHTLSVIGKNPTGIYQAVSNATTFSWTINPAIPAVRLNEVLARNDAAVNHNGTFPDMIELFNEGAATVDLSGLRLTDNTNSPNKFVFPGGTTLATGAYLTLYANNPDGTPGLHLGFGLSQNGGGVFLFDTAASGGALLDSVEYGLQLPDLSIGRFDGAGAWVLAQPTFGAVNVAKPLGSPATLKINEWQTSGVNPYPYDFFELFNPDALPVALGGLFLTDNAIGAPRQNRIAPLSFIGGKGYTAFIADGNPDQGSDHVSFSLSSEQGEIYLLNDSSVIDAVLYGPQRDGLSQGRSPNGSPNIVFLTQPTPGFGNPAPPVLPPSQTITLISYTNLWSYDQTSNYDGVNWTAPAFNDSAWPTGLGVLAHPSTPTTTIAEPVNTTLGLMPTAYYFRARFVVPGGVNLSGLQLTHYFDDGAIVYLNGKEAYRYNMPAGIVTNATFASTTISGVPLQMGPFTFPLTNLVAGTNLIAVEMHQANAASSDIWMGFKLEGVVITNSPVLAGLVINEVLANNVSIREPDNSTPDWVELFNPSNASLNLADMSLTDNPALPRRFVFPAGSIIAARGYLVLRCDGGRPAALDNTGFGLKHNGGVLYMFDTPANASALLDAITFGLQAADFSIGRVPSGGTNWSLTIPTSGGANIAAALGNASQIKINEWMANPASGDDWFEVYNPSAQPVNVSGFYLTDDLNNRTKYKLPALSFIGADDGAFQKFDADNNLTAGPEHVNFKLSNTGEALGIATAAGVLIDGITFGPQAVGISQGRFPDGAGNIISFAASPSPGESNFLPYEEVVVNEVLTHTDLPLEDAIELYNTTGSTIDISGWWLSDSANVLRKYQIPASTILPAHGYAVFYEYQFNNNIAATVPFSLNSAKGDNVHLSRTLGGATLTGYRASAKFGPSANGVSFGRYQTSVGVDFTAMSNLTFGTSIKATDATNLISVFRTGAGAANSYPLISPVVINEIMYHPPDLGTNDNTRDEFIELYNRTGGPVKLYDAAFPTNSWHLRSAVDFDFPINTTIPAGGYLVVVSFDPATNGAAKTAFQAVYGTNATLTGPWIGKLANDTDRIALYRPDAPQTVPGPDFGLVPYILADQVVYQDRAPWSTNADGFGMSLQRVNANLYGNDPVNWIAATPTPGPGGVVVDPDMDHDGMLDAWEIANGFDPNNPDDAAQDADGDGMTNLQEYLAGTDPHDANSKLKIDAIAADAGGRHITFTAVNGKTYTLLYRDSLATGSWQKLSNLPAPGTTQPVTMTDNSPPTGERYYQIVTPAQP